ncbi:hypothetical protein T4E_6869 [Trichinella pseudospiralis]|uniref:Uncharacterized protein n=1 Tax=Trichinella pseudospiralis TaxID=6337 RepID=A0A0V0XNY9_TRIPS|nr:hypothetical protein T4E_6869 [Trichinella pseudospiralis]
MKAVAQTVGSSLAFHTAYRTGRKSKVGSRDSKTETFARWGREKAWEGVGKESQYLSGVANERMWKRCRILYEAYQSQSSSSQYLIWSIKPTKSDESALARF